MTVDYYYYACHAVLSGCYRDVSVLRKIPHLLCSVAWRFWCTEVLFCSQVPIALFHKDCMNSAS